MYDYISLITKALENIDASYFNLPTTYRQAGIPRERIFCYELYHQMRLVRQVMGDTSPMVIHGEIDKAGHEDFDKKHRANPDFVIHRPGYFENNRVVIEVKGKLIKSGVLKDFETLLNFTEHYQYELGVFIIFGYSLPQLAQRIRVELEALQTRMSAAQIHIIALSEPRGKCRHTNLWDLQNFL